MNKQDRDREMRRVRLGKAKLRFVDICWFRKALSNHVYRWYPLSFSTAPRTYIHASHCVTCQIEKLHISVKRLQTPTMKILSVLSLKSYLSFSWLYVSKSESSTSDCIVGLPRLWSIQTLSIQLSSALQRIQKRSQGYIGSK